MSNGFTESLYKKIYLLPFVSLVFFYLFVIYIRVSQGYWPSYNHPDAGVFSGLLVYFDVFILGLLSITLISPGFIVGYLIFNLLSESLREVRFGFLFLCFWILWFVVLWIDPFGFLDWFID